MPKATPVLPISFAVFHDDEPVDATLDFADNADVISTTRWRVPHLDDESMLTRAADAREFALLAAKRWRHYRDTNSAALSHADLRRKIAADPHGEYCFHLKLTADWFPVSLGGAMIRRTWHHHLALDFLFVHPRISSRLVNVKSVGLQILRAVCMIAQDLGCQRVWGEILPPFTNAISSSPWTISLPLVQMRLRSLPRGSRPSANREVSSSCLYTPHPVI